MSIYFSVLFAFNERTDDANIFDNSSHSFNNIVNSVSAQSNPSLNKQNQYLVSLQDLSAIS